LIGNTYLYNFHVHFYKVKNLTWLKMRYGMRKKHTDILRGKSPVQYCCFSGFDPLFKIPKVRILNKAQENSNTQCYAPLSEPFRFMLSVYIKTCAQ
jgi:hypothetical protein